MFDRLKQRFQKIEPITLRDYFPVVAADFLASRAALTAYETPPLDSDYPASTGLSLALRVRMTAAATAIAGQKLTAGRGGMILDKQSAPEKLLGRQATGFRIYNRNLDSDIANAKQLIRIHAPQLLT